MQVDTERIFMRIGLVGQFVFALLHGRETLLLTVPDVRKVHLAGFLELVELVVEQEVHQQDG